MDSPAPSQQPKKRKDQEEQDSPPPTDHRKRRRNRTTQSCLNCHGSKRMCDRKRPACSRCVKLGLSGLCVYEVDDPEQRNCDSDEAVHLRNRIAELEGYIREFKKKPHPRWASDFPVPSTSRATSESLDDCQCQARALSSANSSLPQTPSSCWTLSPSSEHNGPMSRLTPLSLPDTPDALHMHLHSTHDDSPILLLPPERAAPVFSAAPGQEPSSSKSTILASPVATGTNPLVTLFPSPQLDKSNSQENIFDRVFAQILQSEARQPHSPAVCQSCSCCQSPSAYTAVAELTPYLRKVLDTFAALHEQKPQQGRSCELYGQVEDLLSTASQFWGPSAYQQARDSYSFSSFPPSPAVVPDVPRVATTTTTIPLLQPLAYSSHQPWGKGDPAVQQASEIDFMSWEASKPPEWPRTILL